MGNALYQMGDLQKSVELFKEALTLAPNDKDIRYNYELSKRILEQQPPQENKDQNQDGEAGDEEQNQGKENQQSQEGETQNQQSEGGDKKDEESAEKPEQSENREEQDEKEQNQSQDQNGDENNKEEQNQQLSESQAQEQKEKQLGREEAEAILNALKADESNLKPRKYKAVRRIKLEKDW